jgi:hypothetical protein
MKNEGPFIMEWIAYHFAIGFDNIVIGSNDCEDGSDALLDALALEGVISHRRTRAPPNSDPQHIFLKGLTDHPVVRNSDWIMVLDADEFLNVRLGGGYLDDLIAVQPQADAIVVLWKTFGDAGIPQWSESLQIRQFTRCEDNIDDWNRFHKTLFRNNGKFHDMDAHYPRLSIGTKPSDVKIVNSKGESYSSDMFGALAPSIRCLQEDKSLWTWEGAYINHYPYKTPDLFMMKRYRGDNVPGAANNKYVIGSSYHNLKSKNTSRDDSIQRNSRRANEIWNLLRGSGRIREAEILMLHKFSLLRAKIIAQYD